MKKFVFVLTGLVCLSFGFIAGSPGVQENLHWRWASSRDQAQQYAGYLGSWPDGRHAREARQRYDEKSWADATRAGTIQAFTRYLQAHPEGRFGGLATENIEDIDWEHAAGKNTIVSYQRFIETHRDSYYVSMAILRREALAGDDTPFLAARKQGSRQAYESFLSEYPGHRRAAVVLAALKDIEGKDIVDLIAEKKVEVSPQGSGIKMVRVGIRSLVNHEMTVRIPTGTFFVSRVSSVQNMVTTEEQSAVLKEHQQATLEVPAACANRPRSIPGIADRFSVQRSPNRKELEKLLSALRKAAVTFPVQQAAVWIVTDDASYGELGLLVSRPAHQLSGGVRVIGEDETAKAMKICEEAGIDVTRKAVWRDRGDILKGLKDEELKKWLGLRK